MSCQTCARCLLMILNGLLGLLGLFLAVVGGFTMFAFDLFVALVSMTGHVKEMLNVLEETGNVDLLRQSALFLLCVGIAMFVIGIIGFAGALCKGQCLLYSFVMFLVLIIMAEIGLIVYAVVDRGGLQMRVEESLHNTISEYEGNGLHYDPNGELIVADKKSSHVSYAWDYLHLEAECCGSVGIVDWTAFNGSYTLPGVSLSVPAKVPLSCCQTDGLDDYPADVASMTFLDAKTCLSSANETVTNSKGCVQAVFDEVWEFNVIFAGVVGGLIAAQLVELVCAILVIRQASGAGNKAV